MNHNDVADRAKDLVRRGQFADAEDLVRQEIPSSDLKTSHLDVLYILAVAQRYQHKFARALRTLKKLQALDPRFGRAYQEQGHVHRAMGNEADARIAYERAVQLNPALLASWKALTRLYRSANLVKQSKAAAEHATFLENLPEELRSVTSMLHENKLYKAERLCRHFLLNNKHHIEGMRLLAEVGNKLDIAGDPEFLLESCVELAPDYDRARYDYANFLLKMQKFEPAREQIKVLLERDPENLAYLSILANASSGIGNYAEAIRIYDDVLSNSPNQNKLYVMRGHAQKTIGLVAEAVESYQKAYELQPDYGDAFWSLANIKTYRFTDAEIAHMQRFEGASETPADDRIQLCFALGKAFEDKKQYAESFKYYARGNDLKRDSTRHTASRLSVRIRAQFDVCTAALFEDKKGLGFEARDPIFVVGLPRAGSTLLEQILASHSMVDGTFELPNIVSLAQRLGGNQFVSAENETSNYPKMLAEIDHSYFRRFGEQYIETTRIYRKSASHFVDKNPNNFFHIGLIKLILPNAKVIDARRHPMSCCFSVFKQLFGQGQEFSYGLSQIGNYYKEYVGLMDHWDTVLPGFVLRMQYEDVIENLETEVKRLLEFCGLPFEQACVDFHQTQRSVRTPSSEQVRQPIYKTALEHWRNYEPWLDPLKEALGPAILARYPIS